MPKDLSRESIPDWFQKQTQRIGLSELKDAMYLEQSAGTCLVSKVRYCCSLFVLQITVVGKSHAYENWGKGLSGCPMHSPV